MCYSIWLRNTCERSLFDLRFENVYIIHSIEVIFALSENSTVSQTVMSVVDDD